MRQSRFGEVRELLARRDEPGIVVWAAKKRGLALSALFRFTFEDDLLLQWRAVEACGWASRAVYGSSGPERIREFLRSVLWLMNHESGGLAWRGPEVVGEVLRSVPELGPEFGRLLPQYLREEPFQTGACVAIYRCADSAREALEGCERSLVSLLGAQSPETRAVAALALLGVAGPRAGKWLERVSGDSSEVVLYDFGAGVLKRTRVGAVLYEFSS